jgi:hypothetical protein
MKKIVAVLALCASAQGAIAAGLDCRAIQNATERLACYDAAGQDGDSASAYFSDFPFSGVDAFATVPAPAT